VSGDAARTGLLHRVTRCSPGAVDTGAPGVLAIKRTLTCTFIPQGEWFLVRAGPVNASRGDP
jgi:hypothetical protein